MFSKSSNIVPFLSLVKACVIPYNDSWQLNQIWTLCQCGPERISNLDKSKENYSIFKNMQYFLQIKEYNRLEPVEIFNKCCLVSEVFQYQ